MLPRVKEKAEELQRDAIMLKINLKKTIEKMGGKENWIISPVTLMQ